VALARKRVLAKEPTTGLKGLFSLTTPGDDERVSAIVDVAVVGARSDGKTQFIAHAVRTLRAVAPPDLSAEERAGTDAVLEVVMHARAPRTDATEPGRVQHAVFRLRPDVVMRGLGFFGRLGLVIGRGWTWLCVTLALLNAVMVWAGLGLLYGPHHVMPLAGAGAAAFLGLAGAIAFARRPVARAEEIEVVFWDVAGEHVYSGSARDYHTFLAGLVHARRKMATPERRYAFATVLICNPLGVGTSDDPAYVRLRKLIPMFATLHREDPRVLTVVNRWELVRAVCEAGRDADDRVAVCPIATPPDGPQLVEDATPQERLPVLRRGSVQAHCRDGEAEREGDVAYDVLRYDAGMRAEAVEEPWKGWPAVPEQTRAAWLPPADDPESLVVYRYLEGPGTLEGEAGRIFFGWLARMAWRSSLAEPDGRPAEAAPPLKTEVLYNYPASADREGGFRSGGT
jgi:hypothetical protein